MLVTDLKVLIDERYKVEKVIAKDMFQHTPHYVFVDFHWWIQTEQLLFVTSLYLKTLLRYIKFLFDIFKSHK